MRSQLNICLWWEKFVFFLHSLGIPNHLQFENEYFKLIIPRDKQNAVKLAYRDDQQNWKLYTREKNVFFLFDHCLHVRFDHCSHGQHYISTNFQNSRRWSTHIYLVFSLLCVKYIFSRMKIFLWHSLSQSTRSR